MHSPLCTRLYSLTGAYSWGGDNLHSDWASRDVVHVLPGGPFTGPLGLPPLHSLFLLHNSPARGAATSTCDPPGGGSRQVGGWASWAGVRSDCEPHNHGSHTDVSSICPPLSQSPKTSVASGALHRERGGEIAVKTAVALTEASLPSVSQQHERVNAWRAPWLSAGGGPGDSPRSPRPHGKRQPSPHGAPVLTPSSLPDNP